MDEQIRPRCIEEAEALLKERPDLYKDIMEYIEEYDPYEEVLGG